MNLTLEQAVGQLFLLSFTGKREPSSEVVATLGRQHVGGLCLFRARNIGTLEDVRHLTAALQQAAAATGQPPLIIAADQEGGQLMAIGDGTPFPGNMALGATRADDLARRVGHALGRELLALGINANFAPVCDVNVNPDNPVVGARSFGEDPAMVARLSGAMIDGMQSGGVAATAKHFPGHGDTATDSHHGTPILNHDVERLRKVELPPFAAAVRSGVKMVMTAHIALPGLNDGSDIPATLSSAVLRNILRKELHFNGVVVSDALDMNAIQQGRRLMIDVLAGVAAGLDLLLFNLTAPEQERAYQTILQAARRRLLSPDDILASARRILAVKEWITRQEQPPLQVVGSAEHVALANEVAMRSITLVRDTAGRLPLRLAPEARVAAIVPRPEDLTPADTSSYLVPSLATALRRHHMRVESRLVGMDPKDAEVRALVDQVAGYDLVVVGTINAGSHPGQAALVRALLERGTAVIAVALRMPYDLKTYPAAPTFLCTYGILPPSMDALADALWGRHPCTGRLPVSIPGLYPAGHPA